MKNFILFLFLMGILPVSFAQQAKVEGILLLSSDSSQLIGASVVVRDKNAHTIAQTVSDSKGYFNLTVDTQRAYQLMINAVGLRPMSLGIDGLKGNLSLGKLYFEESNVELDEISVIASNHSVNKQLLFPKKYQIESSEDIVALLKQMNLSGLSIEPIEKAVSINDKPVRWLINGIPRSYTDVQSISAKDILRIEYSDTPSTRYLDQGVGGSINIILRRVETGGRLRASLQTALWTGFANTAMHAEHSLGRSIIGIDYSSSYRKYRSWKRTMNQSFISGSGIDIVRDEQGDNSPFGTNMHDIDLSYIYQPNDKTQISAVWRNALGVQNNDIRSLITETGGRSFHRTTNSTYKSYVPALDLFYQQAISQNGKLELNLLGTLIQGQGERDLYDYISGREDKSYHNPTRNSYGSLIGEIAYFHKINSSTELSGGVHYKWARTTDTYYSPHVIANHLNTKNLYAYTQLSGRLSSKLQYNIGTGYKYFYTENDARRRHFSKLQGRLGLMYTIGRGLRLVLNSHFIPALPSLAQLSSTYQQYDSYITYTGNPMLNPSYTYSNTLQVSYNTQKFDTSLSLSYNYTDAPIYTNISYRATDQDWLYYTANATYNSGLGIEWRGSITQIAGALSLYGKLGYKRFQNSIEGILYTAKDLYGDLSAQFQYKAWTLTAYYAYSPCSLYAFTQSETKPEVGATIMWQHKNWTLYTQVMCLGSRYGDFFRETRQSSVNPMVSTVTIGDNKNMLTIGAVWTLNYGKQTSHKKRSTKNYDYSNSLVKVQ